MPIASAVDEFQLCRRDSPSVGEGEGEAAGLRGVYELVMARSRCRCRGGSCWEDEPPPGLGCGDAGVIGTAWATKVSEQGVE